MESSLAAMVQNQGRQLLAQEQRIKELEKRLERVLEGKVEGNQVTEGNEPVVDVQVVEASKENTAYNSAALYEFDQSMWDAALLLFFRKGTNWVDKVILVIGCMLNLFLQLSLLFTISFNMLESPYDVETIREMLKWRVDYGLANSNFDTVTGKSLLTRLCNQELWTYEQEEFKLMYDYLYKEVPGALLSTLAIVMWVLTIMVEYRRCAEQALAVIHLPSLRKGSEFEIDGEEYQILGMHPVKRVLALVLLSLPRLFVMLYLAIIGCQYLAQTVNLGDIVLNAAALAMQVKPSLMASKESARNIIQQHDSGMPEPVARVIPKAVALAFVMDVDELVADVLLTERLRSILPKIQPLSCGQRKKGKCCPIKDMIRYAIAAGQVLHGHSL